MEATCVWLADSVPSPWARWCKKTQIGVCRIADVTEAARLINRRITAERGALAVRAYKQDINDHTFVKDGAFV